MKVVEWSHSIGHIYFNCCHGRSAYRSTPSDQHITNNPPCKLSS